MYAGFVEVSKNLKIILLLLSMKVCSHAHLVTWVCFNHKEKIAESRLTV